MMDIYLLSFGTGFVIIILLYCLYRFLRKKSITSRTSTIDPGIGINEIYNLTNYPAQRTLSEMEKPNFCRSIRYKNKTDFSSSRLNAFRSPRIHFSRRNILFRSDISRKRKKEFSKIIIRNTTHVTESMI
jgi:hypothetical protein